MVDNKTDGATRFAKKKCSQTRRAPCGTGVESSSFSFRLTLNVEIKYFYSECLTLILEYTMFIIFIHISIIISLVIILAHLTEKEF